MRIDLLELQNFRNMKSAKISFQNKNFVVLIGDNGSGKTALLEAITKAFVPVLRTVNPEAVKKFDLTNKDILYGCNDVTVTAHVSFEGETYMWQNRRRLSSQVPFAEKKQTDLKQFKEKYQECLEKRRLPLVLYYGTDRIIRDVPKRGHIKEFTVADALNNCFNNINYFRDFYDWFKTEEDIELRELRSRPDFKNPKLECVRLALSRTIKEYSNLRIELNPSRMLMTNSQGVDLQIEQMSGGYKAVLSVVADIAKRLALAYPDSENPLEERAVVLIDELDLHLHPKWQKSIVGDLKRTFPNCQFIISTHSPFIIQSLEADELFDIDKMSYASEEGSFKGWSIDEIQDRKMGVEVRTELFNELLEKFTSTIDGEDYENAKEVYLQLVEMMFPGSPERKVVDMDMELISADDKAD